MRDRPLLSPQCGGTADEPRSGQPGFGDRGYEHVRIDDVAAAAGKSRRRRTLGHFASKQELYIELMNSAAIMAALFISSM